MTTYKKAYALVLATCALSAMCSFAPIVSAQTDTSADTSCKPIATTECGCGKVLDSNGNCADGTNRYQCPCKQTDAGVTTSGMCDMTGACKANETNGKPPQLPTQAQTGQPQSATPVPVQNSSGSGALVTPDQPIGAAPASALTPQDSAALAPGSSVLESAWNAYQTLVGGQTASPAPDSSGAQPENSQPAEPSWFSGAQGQLQPGNYSGDSGNSPNDTAPAGGGTVPENSTFGPAPDNAAQNLNAIQNTPSPFAQSTLFPVAPTPDMQNEYLTAYGVCDGMPQGCNSMEGAPVTYTAHPADDANGNQFLTNQIYTLQGYANGQYPYITVAGAPNQQGDTGVISQISYTDPATGEQQTLQNVPYMVADTGGAISGNHLDVPLTIPTSDYGNTSAINSILNSQPYSQQTITVIPTDSIQESYAIANPWGSSSDTGGLASYTTQDSGVFPAQETSWANSVLSSEELASLSATEAVASANPEPSGEPAVVEPPNPNSYVAVPIPDSVYQQQTPPASDIVPNAAPPVGEVESQPLPNIPTQTSGTSPEIDWNALALANEQGVAESANQNAILQQADDNALASGYENALAESANQNAALEPPPGEEIANETQPSGENEFNGGVNWAAVSGGELGEVLSPELQSISAENWSGQQLGIIQAELDAETPANVAAAQPAPETAAPNSETPPVSEITPQAAEPSPNEIVSNGFDQFEQGGGQVPAAQEPAPNIAAANPEPPQPVAESSAVQPQSWTDTALSDLQAINQWQDGVANSWHQALQQYGNTAFTAVAGWLGGQGSSPADTFTESSAVPVESPLQNEVSAGNAEPDETQPVSQNPEPVASLPVNQELPVAAQPLSNVPPVSTSPNLEQTPAQTNLISPLVGNNIQIPASEIPNVENANNSANPESPASEPTPAPQSSYTGSSVVDYLNSIGEDSSKIARAALADALGITNYAWTTAQNTELLKLLRGF